MLIDLLNRASINEQESIDFVMCNPPFFRNESELAGTSSNIRNPTKRSAPHSANPVQLSECVFDEHGEVGFVKRIIDESSILKKKIR